MPLKGKCNYIKMCIVLINLTLNLKQSNESYDPELEQEVRDWVSKVTGQPFPDGEIADVLKNGQLLCK